MLRNIPSVCRHLKLLRDSFDPISAKKNTDLIPNILELSRTNLMLAEDVKFKLLGPMNMYPSAVDNVVQNGLSPAEQLACQVNTDLHLILDLLEQYIVPLELKGAKLPLREVAV